MFIEQNDTATQGVENTLGVAVNRSVITRAASAAPARRV